MEKHKHIYLVANKGHSAVMGPRKRGDWGVSIINQLDGPAALIFDPHKDDPC